MTWFVIETWAFKRKPIQLDQLQNNNNQKSINNFISTNIEWVPVNYVEMDPEKKELINEFFEA